MTTNKHRALAKNYLAHLLKGDRNQAIDTILKEVNAGMRLEDVYLDVLQPALYEVGRLWQLDEIDIVIEHYCTAATQLLMAQLFPYALNSQHTGLHMVGCCLGSELHEIGMRMICDLLELDGWDTYFIGAITPGKSLLRTLEEQRPDLLCLSSTMQFGVGQIRDVITDIRANRDLAKTKIMVGGLAFNLNPTLADRVGADATAVNAREAVDVARSIMP
jgi:methanogenic corrinoid protein MtbC1